MISSVWTSNSTQQLPINILDVFKLIRMEAGGKWIAPEIEGLIRECHWENIVSSIPVERFSNEMLQALKQPEPERFFIRMIDFHVGTTYIPELFRMRLVPAGPTKYHPEGDLFTHSVQVLQRVSALSDDPITRFCSMFHDLGKLLTDPVLYPRHPGHDKSGFNLGGVLCDRLKLPDTYKKPLIWVCRLHTKAARWEELKDSTRISMAEQAISAGITDILPDVVAGDKPDKVIMPGWENALKVAQMEIEELGINPSRFMQMTVDERIAYQMQMRVETLRLI